jgi:hypothetical protein
MAIGRRQRVRRWLELDRRSRALLLRLRGLRRFGLLGGRQVHELVPRWSRPVSEDAPAAFLEATSLGAEPREDHELPKAHPRHEHALFAAVRLHDHERAAEQDIHAGPIAPHPGEGLAIEAARIDEVKGVPRQHDGEITAEAHARYGPAVGRSEDHLRRAALEEHPVHGIGILERDQRVPTVGGRVDVV